MVIDKCGEPLSIREVGSEISGRSSSRYTSHKGHVATSGESNRRPTSHNRHVVPHGGHKDRSTSAKKPLVTSDRYKRSLASQMRPVRSYGQNNRRPTPHKGTVVTPSNREGYSASHKGNVVKHHGSSSGFKSETKYIEKATFCTRISYSNNCLMHVLTFKEGTLVEIENTKHTSKIKINETDDE